jgi:hypothetical protein
MTNRYDPLQAIAVQADKMMLCVLWALQLFSLALAGLNDTWMLACWSACRRPAFRPRCTSARPDRC